MKTWKFPKNYVLKKPKNLAPKKTNAANEKKSFQWKNPFRLTIGRKLIALNSVLLIATISTLMWIVTNDLTRDNTALIQQNNAEAAVSLANQTRNVIENVIEKTSLLGRLLLSASSTDIKNAQESFYSRDKNFLGVFVFKQKVSAEANPSPVIEYSLEKSSFSDEFLSSQDSQIDSLLSILKNSPAFAMSEVAKSNSLAYDSFTLPEKGPVLALAISVGDQKNEMSEYVFVGLMSQNGLISNFSKFESLTAFLVNQKGDLIAHSDSTKIAAKLNVSKHEIVKRLLEGKSSNQTLQFIDPLTKEGKLGAFQYTGIPGLNVVIEVPEAKAFEAARQIQKRAFWISIVILSLSFLLAYLYSETISRPIRRLAQASIQISNGDFNIALKTKGHDEVANLSGTFNKMAVDLAQRIRLIETFQKFHNKEIADKLLSGEVALGGETKKAVVFFSDIRGFTAMSETMSPQEVVEMLNEYMTIMVSVIRKHKGIVDKFVGDAIMAIWGVPNESPEDVSNSIKACLEMRSKLSELNEERIKKGKAPLNIGMGLNYGYVVAGNIGSHEKMEYTVIGDTVNVASRIESLTKEMKSDLLISKSVKDAAGYAFDFEECESAFVKGKTDAVEVFKVIGNSVTTKIAA